MEEKDEQILETADALREDIRRIERGQRKMFYKGMTFGVLTTLAVCLLVFFVIPIVQIKRAGGELQLAGHAQQETATGDEDLLTPAVESKIKRLEAAIDQY